MAGEEQTFKNVEAIDISQLLDISEKVLDVEGKNDSKDDKNPEKKTETVLKDDEKEVFNDGTFEIIKEEGPEETSPDDTKDKKIPSNADDSSPSSPYLAFAQYNAEEGVFKDFNEEEWKELVDEFGEDGALFELNRRTIEEEVTNQVEAYKTTLSDRDRVIFDAKVNGLPLDEAGYIYYNKKRFSALTDEDLEKEEVQEELVRHNLELKGTSSDEIKEIIDAFKETDKLKERAKISKGNVVNFYNRRETELKTEAAKLQEEEDKRAEQEIKTVKSYIENVDEIIPGMKVTKQIKEKLFSVMTTPSKTEEGQPINALMEMQKRNPVAFSTALHYYYTLGLFNINEDGKFVPDFSKITGKIQTNVAKETRKIFEQNTAFQGSKKSAAPMEDTDAEEKFSKAFKRVEKMFTSR